MEAKWLVIAPEPPEMHATLADRVEKNMYSEIRTWGKEQRDRARRQEDGIVNLSVISCRHLVFFFVIVVSSLDGDQWTQLLGGEDKAAGEESSVSSAWAERPKEDG